MPSAVVGIVGLGYVGLPLAVEFGKRFPTIGFDLSEENVAAYREQRDPTGEVSREAFQAAAGLQCTTDASRLAEADFIVVAVPTPVDAAHRPDFSALQAASATVGKHMRRGATVIFESTVYPGATVNVLGLTFKENCRDLRNSSVPDKGLLVDVKACIDPAAVAAQGRAYWRL